MKMVMTIIPKSSADTVLNALVNTGYMATYAETRGGMLRQSQVSIYIAVEEDSVNKVLEIIKTNCKSRSLAHSISQTPGSESITETETANLEGGRAVSFVWELDRLEKY